MKKKKTKRKKEKKLYSILTLAYEAFHFYHLRRSSFFFYVKRVRPTFNNIEMFHAFDLATS